MEYKSMMHVAFYTARMEEMIDFYTRQMGGQVKVVMRYESYLERDDRPELQALAKKDPQRLFYVYIELAPLQFIELFDSIEVKSARNPHNKILSVIYVRVKQKEEKEEQGKSRLRRRRRKKMGGASAG